MLIELYVGTLTRYYSEQWQNSRTRAGATSPFTGPQSPNAVTDPVELQGVVAEWLQKSSDKLREHLSEPLTWQEGMRQDYHVSEISFPGYGGVILLAAYSITQYEPRPTEFQKTWNKDPAIEALAKLEPNNAIWEILNCSLWMPCSFEFGIGMKDPSGQSTRAGSVDMLWNALNRLNEANWQASPERIAEWRKFKLTEESSFETQSQFGFSCFYESCGLARAKRLPMKLHY